MKVKAILSILALSAVIYSCGDDDDSDPFDGVPSGEIVDVDEREETLTGSTGSSSSRELAVGDQKWWKHVKTKMQLSGECGDNEELEDTQSNYYGFYPGGEYYYKTGKDGNPVRVGSWEWVDTETKDVMYISNYTTETSGEFTLRSLNENEVVYANEQVVATCTAISWSQFNQPYIETED